MTHTPKLRPVPLQSICLSDIGDVRTLSRALGYRVAAQGEASYDTNVEHCMYSYTKPDGTVLHCAVGMLEEVQTYDGEARIENLHVTSLFQRLFSWEWLDTSAGYHAASVLQVLQNAHDNVANGSKHSPVTGRSFTQRLKREARRLRAEKHPRYRSNHAPRAALQAFARGIIDFEKGRPDPLPEGIY